MYVRKRIMRANHGFYGNNILQYIIWPNLLPIRENEKMYFSSHFFTGLPGGKMVFWEKNLKKSQGMR
jgi:hypothetical protein